MSKELELIAESMRAVATEGAREDGQLWGAFPNTMTVHDLAEHVVSVLSERGYSIVHYRPTCAEAGDSCKHLPECVMAICVCGEEWPCPTVAAAAEEDQ